QITDRVFLAGVTYNPTHGNHVDGYLVGPFTTRPEESDELAPELLRPNEHNIKVIDQSGQGAYRGCGDEAHLEQLRNSNIPILGVHCLNYTSEYEGTEITLGPFQIDDPGYYTWQVNESSSAAGSGTSTPYGVPSETTLIPWQPQVVT